MRALRLSLTGTLMLMLLGGPPALAEEAEGGAVLVTGTQAGEPVDLVYISIRAV